MSATTSSESALSAAWSELRRRGRTALIPYLTAGHPSFEASLDALRRADEQCDILEVGVPFSDPLAPGGTGQDTLGLDTGSYRRWNASLSIGGTF